MFPEWRQLTDAQRERWEAVLGTLATAVPPGAVGVIVDGQYSADVADRLANELRSAGRACARLTAPDAVDDTETRLPAPAATTDTTTTDTTTTDTVTVADGPQWRDRPPTRGWDLTVLLRSPGGPVGAGPDSATRSTARIVLDLGDPAWPVIRGGFGPIALPPHWYVAENQAFFAVRAAEWDSRFGDDIPAYAAAVAEAAPPVGGTALDLGCGTGRALPALRTAVGPSGRVVGLDVTPQMLDAARAAGREQAATALLLADANRLPFADASVDLIFAAGLVNHLEDVNHGLRELARVAGAGAQLVLFHPTGRAALAARHGRVLRPDEPLSEPVLATNLAKSGWQLRRYSDAQHRFFALATRPGQSSAG